MGKPNETNQCGKGVSVMHDIIMMHIPFDDTVIVWFTYNINNMIYIYIM